MNIRLCILVCIRCSLDKIYKLSSSVGPVFWGWVCAEKGTTANIHSVSRLAVCLNASSAAHHSLSFKHRKLFCSSEPNAGFALLELLFETPRDQKRPGPYWAHQYP